MKNGILAFAITGLLCVSPLKAEFLNVQAGNHELLTQTAGQVIDIRVEGDGNVQLLNFEVQVGNGKTDEVPAITNVDIISDPGMLFGTNNNGIGGTGSGAGDGFAGFWSVSTAADTGTVTPASPNSVLARVTISTVGYDMGSSFALILNNEASNPPISEKVATNFGNWGDGDGNTLNIIDGTVTVVPEPSSFLLFLGVGGLGLAVLSRRRRRAGR